MVKVSVVIPVYNKEKYVKEALESVFKQTYKDIEILVLNDASEDKSADIIQEIIKDHPEIIYINEKENIGVCAARNKLINMAKGEYILPFDADDILDETYIEKFVRALDDNPEYSVVYCDVKYFQAENYDIYCNFDEEKILYFNCLISSSMFRKKHFEEIGGYKKWLNDIGCEDWELWITFFEKGFKFYKINEVLYHYRKLGDEACRTHIHDKNIDLIKFLILSHHIKTYLNNKKFTDAFLDSSFVDFKKIKRRSKKYKKLFNILLIAVIVEFVLIVGFLLSFVFFALMGGGKMSPKKCFKFFVINKCTADVKEIILNLSDIKFYKKDICLAELQTPLEAK